MPAPSPHPRRLRAAFRPALVGVVLLLLAGSVVTVARAGRAHTWPHGVVRYYDATRMDRTVSRAVQRWNASGAHVHLRRVDSVRAAQLVLRVDDPKLLRICGDDCLGFTSDIGRPPGGRRSEVLLSALAVGHATAALGLGRGARARARARAPPPRRAASAR